MGSHQSASNDETFQQRLSRVRERQAPEFASRPPVEVLPNWRENISGPAGYVFAFLIGCMSVFFVRLIRFHVLGNAITGPNADLAMGIETFGAMTLSFVIFMLLPWKGYQYKLVQFSGIALVIVTMHNMVHRTPTLFGLLFSEEWAAEITEETVPNSIYVRGQSIPFSGKLEEETQVAEAAAPAKPQAIRMGNGGGPKSNMPRRIQIGQ